MRKTALAPEPPLPDVPPRQIVDFDFFAVQPVDADLHLGWSRLHDGPDMFYTPRNGDPSLILAAIDELLRRHAIANFGRVAMQDVECCGVRIRWMPRIPSFRIAEGEKVRAHSWRVNAITHLPLSWA